MSMQRFSSISPLIVALSVGLLSSAVLSADLQYDRQALPRAKPWTSESFRDAPGNFQFVIIGDRTGGANVKGTFKLALKQLELLQPEFVINVGDLIEGYSDKKAELNAEWDALDEEIKATRIPFFRTPGNHDIANKTAQQVWRERYGASYYHFVYNNTLFLVLDSEAPPPRGAPGHQGKT